MSRTSLLPASVRMLTKVAPPSCASSKVTVLTTAPSSLSGAVPGISMISVCTIRSLGTISR